MCRLNLGFIVSFVYHFHVLVNEHRRVWYFFVKVCRSKLTLIQKNKFKCFQPFAIQYFPVSDLDECTLGIDVCDSRSTCRNTPGNYKCICHNGYTVSTDKTHCTGRLKTMI